MLIQDSKAFRKELLNLPTETQLQAIECLENIEKATTFSEISHLKKLKGHSGYFRVRLSNYRIGLFWTGQTFIAETIAVRGNFYKKYPPK